MLSWWCSSLLRRRMTCSGHFGGGSSSCGWGARYYTLSKLNFNGLCHRLYEHHLYRRIDVRFGIDEFSRGIGSEEETLYLAIGNKKLRLKVRKIISGK